MERTDLILFDIDGTLLRGFGVGRRTMEAAFLDELGEAASLAHVPFHGNTDPSIVEAGFAALGLSSTPARVAAVLDRYVHHLRVEVDRQNPYTALPGAGELVRALHERGVPLGLGTGNIETTAWLKVEAIGLRAPFDFGGFGSDHAERGELLRIGWHRGAAHLGVAPERCRVLIVGDTLRDIAAARHIGAEVLAVATGGDSVDTLAAEHPDHLVDSLEDPSVRPWIERWLAR